jgi:alginate O-acetyltransferase complex protein AlgI
MLFNSLGFLLLFLPITYFVFWRLKTREQRYIWLTITGYVFYSFWNYKFCALMAFSTLVSYFGGLGMLRSHQPGFRKLCLIIPIATDLLLLGFFKYTNFILSSTGWVAGWLGIPFQPPAFSIVLPVGISFYTFHTITYVVDCYRGTIKPTRHFFEFSCYVSLFSQLVAGPIVRFRQIEGDLDKIDQADRKASLNSGWSFFVIGMIKKVILADTLAALINPVLNEQTEFSTVTAWLCMLGYTYQLYFDFSGYSDMAVGLGRLFGLRLPQNFNSPYQATSPADFWRRWHISLSSCLRDYLYIPLGGSRGTHWQTYRNVIITMLLGGLWHGANWTFVFWGFYHGLLLVAHRQFASTWERLPMGIQRAMTFILVVLGWVFFRSTNFTMALALLRAMFGWVAGPLLPWGITLLIVLGAAAAVAHAGRNTFELRHEWHAGPSMGWASLFAICLFLIYGGQPSPFLYFQF